LYTTLYWFLPLSLYLVSKQKFLIFIGLNFFSEPSSLCNNRHGRITITSLPLQIIRGSAYSFSANISVEACSNSMMKGELCNSTVYPLSCTVSDAYNSVKATVTKPLMENVMTCKSNLDTFCAHEGVPELYSLDVTNMVEELIIKVENVKFNTTTSNNTSSANDVRLMGFVRHGAIPSETLHDYSGDLNKAPLIIRYPLIGRLYISIVPVNVSKKSVGTLDGNLKVCYSMESQVLQCALGKAGPNCTMDSYTLQVVWIARCISISIFIWDGALFLMQGFTLNFIVEQTCALGYILDRMGIWSHAM